MFVWRLSCTGIKMVYPCRNKDCARGFSTVFNRNKHEKLKRHSLQKKNNVIKFNKELSLFICPTTGCSTTFKYKNNIVKHLKSCFAINQQRNSVTDNKICPVCIIIIIVITFIHFMNLIF